MPLLVDVADDEADLVDVADDGKQWRRLTDARHGGADAVGGEGREGRRVAPDFGRLGLISRGAGSTEELVE